MKKGNANQNIDSSDVNAKRSSVEIALDDQAYENGCKEILEKMQALYELGKSKGLAIPSASKAIGTAMLRYLKIAQSNLNDDQLQAAFPRGINKTDLTERLGSNQKLCHMFITHTVRLQNTNDLIEYNNSKANKSDLRDMCEKLYQSSALNPLFSELPSYIDSAKFAHSKRHADELKRIYADSQLDEEGNIVKTSTTKKVLLLLFDTGIIANVAEEKGIALDSSNAIHAVVEELFRIKEKGLSNRQIDMIYETELANKKRVTVKGDIKSSWGEMNFISYLKLFSNKYYDKYRHYINNKINNSAELIHYGAFLKDYHSTPHDLRLEKFKGVMVSITAEELYKLSQIERDILLPRITDITFKKLEYHIQFNRVVSYSTAEFNVITLDKELRDKKAKEEAKARAAALAGKSKGPRTKKEEKIVITYSF